MDSEQRVDPRRRELHPERITVGDEVFLRNDVLARELGCSERSVDRGDKEGAPYRFIGGIKYRPQRRYAEFFMAGIQTSSSQRRKQSSKKTRGRRTK